MTGLTELPSLNVVTRPDITCCHLTWHLTLGGTPVFGPPCTRQAVAWLHWKPGCEHHPSPCPACLPCRDAHHETRAAGTPFWCPDCGAPWEYIRTEPIRHGHAP